MISVNRNGFAPPSKMHYGNIIGLHKGINPPTGIQSAPEKQQRDFFIEYSPAGASPTSSRRHRDRTTHPQFSRQVEFRGLAAHQAAQVNDDGLRLRAKGLHAAHLGLFGQIRAVPMTAKMHMAPASRPSFLEKPSAVAKTSKKVCGQMLS